VNATVFRFSISRHSLLVNVITVLVCDDHAVMREGLKLLLNGAKGIQVVGEAADGRRAVEEAKRLLPDVVILDLSMPLLNGLEAARQIAMEVPTAKVVMLSAYSDDPYVRKAVEVGAAGYLMKETAGEDLLQAIREVYKGNAFFSPQLGKNMLAQAHERKSETAAARAKRLTSRQTEILQLIAEGHTNKSMAALLFVSIKTVEKHRQMLMDKLNIHETASLTRYAADNGIIRCSVQITST
jgi:DNA-binding NarL/FixJ family response regulator